MKEIIRCLYYRLTRGYQRLSLIAFIVLSFSAGFSSEIFAGLKQNIDGEKYLTDKKTNNNDSITSNIQTKQKVDSSSNNPLIKNDRLNYLKDRLVNEITNHKPGMDTSKNLVDVSEKDQLSKLMKYQGKVIRNINFKKLEIFGRDVKDTTEIPTKWPEQLGNELHINTQDHVLRNRLLFHSGDTVDLYLLSENERLLREMPFVDDARVMISEIDADTVDITFITKDVLPIGGSLELFDVDQGKVSLSNKNVLGLGHELYYHLTWNYDRIPLYGHKILYRIQNIRNTFFSLDASYENQWNLKAMKLYCSRDFFTQNVRYAGGVGFEKIKSLRNIAFPDTTLNDIEVDYNYYDLWLGRAISLPSISSINKKTNIVGTGRIIRYEFFKYNGPQIEESLLYNFHERTNYLFSIGLSQVGYYKTSEVYSFGRTEDIPFGYSMTFTTGVESDQFTNRPYLGLSCAWGNLIRNFGYLYNRFDYGTFFNYGIEQGLLIYKFKYFTNLLNKSGRYSYRIFSDFAYKRGYNRFNDEFMELSPDNGIRGLKSEKLRGNQLMNLSLESVCYSPHVVMGFRFVYFLFFDTGIIANQKQLLINNHLYTGFGGGIKIRNENLIFDTLLLRFGYYPLLPEQANVRYIDLTSTRSPHLDNFVLQRPEIIGY